MKLFSIILSFCFVALTVSPCLKQYFDTENKVASCCSLIPEEHSEPCSNNQHSDNDCNDCSPLASCHCCSMIFSFVQTIDIDNIAIYQANKINYSESFPPTLIFVIWQPPKIS